MLLRAFSNPLSFSCLFLWCDIVSSTYKAQFKKKAKQNKKTKTKTKQKQKQTNKNKKQKQTNKKQTKNKKQKTTIYSVKKWEKTNKPETPIRLTCLWIHLSNTTNIVHVSMLCYQEFNINPFCPTNINSTTDWMNETICQTLIVFSISSNSHIVYPIISISLLLHNLVLLAVVDHALWSTNTHFKISHKHYGKKWKR